MDSGVIILVLVNLGSFPLLGAQDLILGQEVKICFCAGNVIKDALQKVDSELKNAPIK